MNRRDTVLAVLALGVSPLAVNAQAVARIPVIGLLDSGERKELWAAFRQQLRELGYIDGQNVAFETRLASGNSAQLDTMAQELVRLRVSVIVTSGTLAADAAKQATSAIPIVITTGSESSITGVASLARPGGNLTGVLSITQALVGKRFEILREVLPKISRLAVLLHRDNTASMLSERELEGPARSSKVALHVLGVKGADEIAGAFSEMTRKRAQAVFVIPGPVFFSERRKIGDLALKHHLPSMATASDYVEAGGLLSYGANYSDLFRHAAVYVDKILKGAKPGDLPIERPTHFYLAVNLKTAKALGLSIPKVVLFRADRVIE
jgi:putative ABC transport system substrate-binding protein